MNKEKIEKILSDFDGTIGAGFKDLTSGLEFYFQPGEVFPAASMIKVPVLMEFFRQAEEGILNPDEMIKIFSSHHAGGAGVLFEFHEGLEVTLMDLARLMIVVSDNSATNILIKRLGFEKINSFINELGMKKSCLRRFMMVPYEPEEENLITIEDFILLMEKLFRGDILCPEYTKEAINILKRQQYNEKIPLYLPEDLEIAHKTGEIDGVRHDGGIVFLKSRVYILALFTKNVSHAPEADRTIGDISRIFYSSLQE